MLQISANFHIAGLLQFVDIWSYFFISAFLESLKHVKKKCYTNIASLTTIFSKVLFLRCQFDNLAEIYIIPTIGLCLHWDFISTTRNVDLADILHPEGGVTQNRFNTFIRMSQIKVASLILGFQKMYIVSTVFKLDGVGHVDNRPSTN